LSPGSAGVPAGLQTAGPPLAGSSRYLLAGVVGTCGWGAMGASWQWQLEQAVLLCFKVGWWFGGGGFLGIALALTQRCSRPRYRAVAELEALDLLM